MKRVVPIENTFGVIRTLQPEMDFLSIQQFVMLHPVIPIHPHFNWLTFKNFFPMVVITSVVTVALLLSRPAYQVSSPVSKSNHETIPPLIEAPLTVLPDSPEKKPVKVVPHERKKSVASVSTSVSGFPEITSSPETTASQATAFSAAASVIADSSAVIVIVNTCKESDSTDERVRTTTSAKCKCSFGDDNDWINDIVKALLKEKLITSECEYKFKLTAHSFYVNGKDMNDEKFVAKMMELYAASTGERLRNEKDYIMVKVTEDCCSVSKSISD